MDDTLAVAAALQLTPCDFMLGNLHMQLPVGQWVGHADGVWFESDRQRLLRYVMHRGACVWVELA